MARDHLFFRGIEKTYSLSEYLGAYDRTPNGKSKENYLLLENNIYVSKKFIPTIPREFYNAEISENEKSFADRVAASMRIPSYSDETSLFTCNCSP